MAGEPAASQVAATPFTAKRVPHPELLRVFFALGILGFGGPAAHIALMEQELVTRRAWLSHDYFLELLAAINLVPGPSSTELALYIGWVTGGFWGFLAAGAGFIGPAVMLSIALAMIYTAFGTLPAINGILDGVKPIVLVLILSAAYRLGSKAIDNTVMRVLLAGSLLAVLISNSPIMGLFGLSATYVPELIILLACGGLYTAYYFGRRSGQLSHTALIVGLLPGTLSRLIPDLAAYSPTLTNLFGQFFIIGATLFGSGYVLAAYMQRTFVDALGWLTPHQLLDTLAIGQTTPGPVTSTVSAAGYVMTVIPGNLWSGIPGAVVATVAVFLPAFIIVAILNKLLPLLRSYPGVQIFLKGVNAGVIALLIGTFLNLALATISTPAGIDWLALIITILAFIGIERYKFSPLLLIAVGAGIGLARVVLG